MSLQSFYFSKDVACYILCEQAYPIFVEQHPRMGISSRTTDFLLLKLGANAPSVLPKEHNRALIHE